MKTGKASIMGVRWKCFGLDGIGAAVAPDAALASIILFKVYNGHHRHWYGIALAIPLAAAGRY